MPETFVAKFITAGTKVLVSNSSHVLTEHVMKHDFRVFAHDVFVDPTASFVFPHDDGSSRLMKLRDYFPDVKAVATGNPRWPYIVYMALNMECRVLPELQTPFVGRRSPVRRA